VKFTHVLLTRPREQSEELASMLAPLGLKTIIQPAFRYLAQDARAAQPEEIDALEAANSSDLVVFTSPRAVMHGLAQISRDALSRCRVCAIGPATAKALSDAGVRVSVVPPGGYTSEDLLHALSVDTPAASYRPASAWIIAAPGGRTKLAEGLDDSGWNVAVIHVYRSVAAELDRAALGRLDEAAGLLSVWTSANTMQALSQRIPPAAWLRICQGEWLVISERLRRLARAYGPGKIHLSAGPGNAAIYTAIRSQC
jgi:uroporphyrinogen-III synthase